MNSVVIFTLFFFENLANGEVANQLSILERFIQENFYIISASIAAAVFINTWLWRFRPKAKSKIIAEYIDDTRIRKIEYSEITIYWGKIPFYNKIKLAETYPGAITELTIIPPDGVEQTITESYYDVKPSKHTKKIIVKNKKFFENLHVDKIRILVESPISTKYREKIKKNSFDEFIEIENNNALEIKNYLMELPEKIELGSLRHAYGYIDSVRFSITIPRLLSVLNNTLSSLRQDGMRMELLIPELPSRDGTVTKKVRIPLK